MRRLHVLFLALSLLTACNKSSPSEVGPGESTDGFAVGHTALALMAAPPGLCEGDGAKKECEGECAEGVDSEGAAVPPALSGSAGTFASAGIGGNGGSGGFDVSGAAGMSAGVTASQPPFDPGGADGGIADVDACVPIALDDGGVLSCDEPDAGSDTVAFASAALVTSDVPACGSINSSEPYTLYMSADDSNSMASPVIARRLIRSGRPVPSRIVRAYEFLNYYSFAFEPAAHEEVRIVPQLSSCPTNGELSFQVALQAEARAASERRPLNLTLVLDTSGSMMGEPIALLHAAVRAIASQLREGDVVSMVTWDETQRDVLTGHQISGANDPIVLAASEATIAAGGTDLSGGLVRGYELAQQQYSPERINRVVIISDGGANVGVTDENLIGMHANDEEGQAGIYLAGIGVGDGVNDTLMNVVTDVGRGAYVYLDSAQEAQRMLGDRFLSVVDLAARSVRLEVTLPWYLTLQKFFGEVASTNAAVVRPQHLGPNDAMVFFQILKACDPTLLHGDDRVLVRATWQTPFAREPREAVLDTTLNALAGDDDELTKAAAIAGYAEALVAVEGVFDSAQRAAILGTALANVRAAKNAATDPDLLEVAELLEQYMGVPAF